MSTGIGPVNETWTERNPWRNSTIGQGSASTRKQRDYVRKLEEWTASEPVSDSVLNSMDRTDIDGYIETLKWRLEKQDRPSKKQGVVPADECSDRRPTEKQTDLMDRLSVQVDIPNKVSHTHCSYCASRRIDELLTLVRGRTEKVAA